MTDAGVAGRSPTGPRGRAALTITLVAIAQLTVVLDATIVDVALPSIQDDLGFSTTTLSWVVNAYVLAFGGFLLLGGRAGDVLGRRRVFTGGVTLFAAGSLLGGLAGSGEVLLVARAVQGLGAAVIAPTVLAIIATSFHDERTRSIAFGVFGGVSAAGAAIGLLLGGILTESLTWRAVFFVNIPIAVAMLVAAPLCMPPDVRRPGRFDLPGALLSTAGVGALVFGLIRVADEGWSAPVPLVCLAAAVVLLVGFVLVELRAEQPITPLHLFSDRTRSGIYVIALGLTGAFMGIFFFLTIFMQQVLGYGVLETGLAFLPLTVVILAGAGLGTALMPRTGPVPLLVCGLVLNVIAFSWLSRIEADGTYTGDILGPLLVFGLGTGLLFVPLSMLGVSGVEEHEAGSASSLFDAAQQVGGAIGLAVLVVTFGRSGAGAVDPGAGLVDGVQGAFLAAAVITAAAALVAVAMVRAHPQAAPDAAPLVGTAGEGPAPS